MQKNGAEERREGAPLSVCFSLSPLRLFFFLPLARAAAAGDSIRPAGGAGLPPPPPPAMAASEPAGSGASPRVGGGRAAAGEGAAATWTARPAVSVTAAAGRAARRLDGLHAVTASHWPGRMASGGGASWRAKGVGGVCKKR